MKSGEKYSKYSEEERAVEREREGGEGEVERQCYTDHPALLYTTRQPV